MLNHDFRRLREHDPWQSASLQRAAAKYTSREARRTSAGGFESPEAAVGGRTAKNPHNCPDAVEALVRLGCKRPWAEREVATAELSGILATEDIVRWCLKKRSAAASSGR